MALKQIATLLFRSGKWYRLAAVVFLHLVRDCEAKFGACSLELACRYNDLAAAYLMLGASSRTSAVYSSIDSEKEMQGGPRNQEALAYLQLAYKMITFYLPHSNIRVEAVNRNLERAKLVDKGPKWNERPYLYYLSLDGGPKNGGKKKGKKKK